MVSRDSRNVTEPGAQRLLPIEQMVQSLRSWFCNGLVVNSRMDELFLGMDQWEMKNGK